MRTKVLRNVTVKYRNAHKRTNRKCYKMLWENIENCSEMLEVKHRNAHKTTSKKCYGKIWKCAQES